MTTTDGTTSTSPTTARKTSCCATSTTGRLKKWPATWHGVRAEWRIDIVDGTVFADFEGKGKLDLWVTDGHYNRLLRNMGKQGFDDIGASNGVSQTNAQYVSWGTGVYDFDNDGLLDILIFHGGADSPDSAGAYAVSRVGRWEVCRCFGVGGTGAERADDGARRVFLQTTTTTGKMDAFVVNLGARGTLAHNVSANTGPLDRDQAQGHEEQSGRHWGAGGGVCRGQAADCGTRGRFGISFGRTTRGRIGISFAGERMIRRARRRRSTS